MSGSVISSSLTVFFVVISTFVIFILARLAMRHESIISILGVLAFVVVLLLLVYGYKVSENEQKQWNAYAQAHACKVVEVTKAESRTIVGVGYQGKPFVIPLYTPQKTAYACNDGVTYWR